jgi:hypothetical protein
MNTFKFIDSPDGNVICTSSAVNGNRSNTTGTFFIREYINASAPRFDVNRERFPTRTPGDTFYQGGAFYAGDTNGFRPVVLVCNLTPTASNDIPAQTFGHVFAGWRFEQNLRNYANGSNRIMAFSTQTAVVTNATWSSNVATLTMVMNSQNLFFNGESITVQGVIPDGFNGTFNLTGTPTLTTITYQLGSNPGTYTAGTGTISLNTSTTLATNHLRIGANTSSGNIDNNTPLTTLNQFYSYGIGEIIAFNRNLSLEERQLLEGWASQKYNCQGFLANNQATVRSENSFQISSVSYTGTGPYTYTVTYPSTAAPRMEFCIFTRLTISGCTGTETALNRSSWGVTATTNDATNTTVTFVSPTILTSATTVSSADVRSGRVSGTTTLNTFIHPYRVNTTTISPSLDLTKTYTHGLAMWFDAANSSTIGFSSGNLVNSWSSAGGNISGLALTKDIVANQPTIEYNVQNGLPGIKFVRGSEDGGTFPDSSNLTTPGTPSTFNMNQFTTISSNNEYTNFIVVKFLVNPANGHTAMVISSSTDRPYLIKGNLVQYKGGIISQEFSYSPALVINTPYIITITRRGSTGRAIIVGNNARNITETSFAENLQITGSFTRVTMGGFGPNPSQNNDAFEGYIHEFVGFRYALTDQAIYQMEGYLAWKWGLHGAPPVGSSSSLVSLPETHPYRRIRP